MSAAPTAAPAATGRHQRSIKNYLLDTRFQLKHTAMIVGVAIVISGFLGGFLAHTNNQLVTQSERVVAESKKVSDVVKMNIKNDPIYSENTELAAAVTATNSEQDAKIEAQQQSLVREQNNMIRAVVGALTLLVVLLGLLGIYFTHKIVGPIYKMKGLLRQVGDGKLNFYSKLRKGDELQDFFETFAEMVEKLKTRQAREVELLELAMAEATKSGASKEAVHKIGVVRDEMKAALDK